VSQVATVSSSAIKNTLVKQNEERLWNLRLTASVYLLSVCWMNAPLAYYASYASERDQSPDIYCQISAVKHVFPW